MKIIGVVWHKKSSNAGQNKGKKTMTFRQTITKRKCPVFLQLQWPFYDLEDSFLDALSSEKGRIKQRLEKQQKKELRKLMIWSYKREQNWKLENSAKYRGIKNN